MIALLASAALIGGSASPVAAASSQPSPALSRRAAAVATQAISSKPARGSTPSIVISRSGTALYSRNVSTPMVPASLLKLVTTTASVMTLGADATFVTKVVAPPPAEGAIGGNLFLVGGGDPTFATETFARRYFVATAADGSSFHVFPSGSPTVESLADKIVAAGVKSVSGDLVVDESIFDSKRWQRGWQSSYQRSGDVDVGNLSGMTVNMGFAGETKQSVASSPAASAGSFLRRALASRGVSIAGTVRTGTAPAGLAEIARVASPPLREIVGWTNRWSVNYPAEMLLKGLGAHATGTGTTSAGAAAVRAALKGAGIPTDGLTMEDGSGLSLLDRAEARTIAGTLRWALSASTPAGSALRDSLPVAGRPGTLLKRMQSSPTGGNLRGKTGMIRGVRGMAGWVRASDGSTVIYVALFNHAQSPSALTAPLDAFGRGLASMPN